MTIYKAILFGCLFLTSVASGAAEPADPLKTAEALPVSTPATPSDKAAEILSSALGLVGVKYKYGGRSPESGLDCSGFVGHVFHNTVGLVLPRSASAISMVGSKIAQNELRPGDLVFFKTMRKAISHVGIYLGDNQFVHASSSKTGDVMVSNMTEKYWSKHFSVARRVELSTPSSVKPAE